MSFLLFPSKGCLVPDTDELSKRVALRRLKVKEAIKVQANRTASAGLMRFLRTM